MPALSVKFLPERSTRISRSACSAGNNRVSQTHERPLSERSTVCAALRSGLYSSLVRGRSWANSVSQSSRWHSWIGYQGRLTPAGHHDVYLLYYMTHLKGAQVLRSGVRIVPVPPARKCTRARKVGIQDGWTPIFKSAVCSRTLLGLLGRQRAWNEKVHRIEYRRILIKVGKGSIGTNKCSNDLAVGVSEWIEIALLLKETQ
jgi:hypothetical protein